MKTRDWTAIWLALLVGVACAQGMPIPSPEQIDQQIATAIANLPVVDAEEDEAAAVFPVDVRYRELPTDPVELLRSQVPSIPGQDPAALVKQFLPQAMPSVREHARDIGTLVCSQELKLGRERIPAGEHILGVIFNETVYQPEALVIHGDLLEEDVVIKLKTKRSKEEFDVLRITIVGKRKDFTLAVGWGATISSSKAFKPVD